MTGTEIVKAFITALESKDFEGAASWLSEGFQFSGGGMKPMGRMEFIALERALFSAFTAYTHNIGRLHEEGEVVHAVVRITGIHTGSIPVPGKPPVAATGRAIGLPEQQVEYRIDEGKIAAIRLEPAEDGGIDGLLRQLGAARTTAMPSRS